ADSRAVRQEEDGHRWPVQLGCVGVDDGHGQLHHTSPITTACPLLSDSSTATATASARRPSVPVAVGRPSPRTAAAKARTFMWYRFSPQTHSTISSALGE